MNKTKVIFTTVLMVSTLALASCGDKGNGNTTDTNLKNKVENITEEDLTDGKTKIIDGKEVTDKQFKDGTGGMVTEGDGNNFDEDKKAIQGDRKVTKVPGD